MKQLIFTPLTVEELKVLLVEVLEEHAHKQSLINPQPQSSTKEAYVTRKEVAERLRVSLPTLNTLTRQGVLKAHRIGRRVLYRWEEIEQVLYTIDSTKYKRKDLQ